MQILAIQIDRPFLRVALIEKCRKGIEIRTLKSAPLLEADDVKQLYTNFKGKIVTGISSKDLMIRVMELKIGQNRHAEQAIAFQSEATSHFNPADILTVPRLEKKKEGNIEALLFTVPKEALRNYLQEFDQLEIDPDAISSICSGLCNFIKWKIPALTDAFIIDLGSHEWTCAWMEKGNLRKSLSISGGIEDLMTALWEDRKKILLQKEIEGVAMQIDLQQLKPHLNPHLTAKLHELRLELAKIIYSFHRIAGFKPLLFTGRTDAFVHLREYLMESFKDAVSGECKGSLTLEEQKYAIPIGLAFEQTFLNPLQFRREEFFPNKNWKRIGIFSIAILVFSLLFSSALFIFGISLEDSRKMEMIESLNSSLDRWDPQLKRKIFSEGNNEEEILDRWINAVESYNKEYTYIPQSPKVAEVLAWLSSHPVVEALKNEGDPMIVRDLHYQLLQYPKLGSTKEPYLAKVELEFQVKGSMHARKFHEALLKGDDKVDPHLEITWETLADGYRTSFFLKNRSPHVP